MFRETDTNTQLSLFEDPVDFMGKRAAKKFDDPKSWFNQFFAIKNGHDYAGSVLGQLFVCKRDLFYRLMANENLHWRQVFYSFNRRLLKRIALRSDAKSSKDPRCLIVDDTDFPKAGRKGAWNALLSTDTALCATEAYKIYSMRWSIEVSFAEAKRLPNLGKCQCRDFASQISSVSLCMLQYNILGYVKRYESYETIGGLFREVSKSSVELTVTEKIWGIIMEVLQTLADAFSFDRDEMMRAIINNSNDELSAVRRAIKALQSVA